MHLSNSDDQFLGLDAYGCWKRLATWNPVDLTYSKGMDPDRRVPYYFTHLAHFPDHANNLSSSSHPLHLPHSQHTHALTKEIARRQSFIMSPSLTTIPPEIHGLIGNHVSLQISMSCAKPTLKWVHSFAFETSTACLAHARLWTRVS